MRLNWIHPTQSLFFSVWIPKYTIRFTGYSALGVCFIFNCQSQSDFFYRSLSLYNSTKALCFVSLLTAFCTLKYKQLVKSQITPKTSKAKVNLLALASNTFQDDHKHGSWKMAWKLGRDQARLSFSFFSWMLRTYITLQWDIMSSRERETLCKWYDFLAPFLLLNVVLLWSILWIEK